MEALTSVPIVKSFLIGSFSGTCSTLLFQPLDLVKTRLQVTVLSRAVSSPYSPGVIGVVGRVVRQEKLLGLWKGMTPSMARCVPGVGLYFAALQFLTSRLTNGDPTAIQAVGLGVTARTFSGTCLLPFTVVKTRYESGVYQYNGVISALKKIYRTEGARGLYSGMFATLIRDAPFSGLYLMFYTQIRKHCPSHWRDGQFSHVTYFSCGVVAGCLSSFVTQPADVLKTHLQLYPDRFGGKTSVAIWHLYETHGVKGYFKGLAPRMLRRTLMSAMSWTIYEYMIKRIGLK